jgi:phage baseplate assembly protein W
MAAQRVPHLDYPFRVRRRAATVEQDTVDEVIDCVYAILATEPGSRLEAPDFGLADQSFRQGGADLVELAAVVKEWEPRADLLTSSDWAELVQRVRVEVAIA